MITAGIVVGVVVVYVAVGLLLGRVMASLCYKIFEDTQDSEMAAVFVAFAWPVFTPVLLIAWMGTLIKRGKILNHVTRAGQAALAWMMRGVHR